MSDFYPVRGYWPRVYGTIDDFKALPETAQPAAPNARKGHSIPLVGIIRNPLSHRNLGKVAELADCSNILTKTPETRAELRIELAEFARRQIDLLVVDGGDGTVRDVLTCGADIFGDTWPQLIILPKGKTNALTVDLGLPNKWSLTEAMACVTQGKTLQRRPLKMVSRSADVPPVLGFILGTGIFSLATEAGQEAHRRGAFNSFAVGLTILWAIVQALFGRASNVWRACTPMRLMDSQSGAEIAYTGDGNPAERFVMVATSFERFPMGLKPFGAKVPAGIKVGLIDTPRRWIVALVPAILMGFYGQFLTRKGAQRFHTEGLDMQLGGSFILDGEAFPEGDYRLQNGPLLNFIIP